METKRNIDVQNYLPHREPMLMVDKVVEICREKVVTSFRISEENIFLDNGYFSESGIVENMAQTCSTITGQDLREQIGHHDDPGSQVIGFITNIKKVKIYSLPKVGEEILSTAELQSQFGEICNVHCSVFRDKEILAESDISLFIKAL